MFYNTRLYSFLITVKLFTISAAYDFNFKQIYSQIIKETETHGYIFLCKSNIHFYLFLPINPEVRHASNYVITQKQRSSRRGTVVFGKVYDSALLKLRKVERLCAAEGSECVQTHKQVRVLLSFIYSDAEISLCCDASCPYGRLAKANSS